MFVSTFFLVGTRTIAAPSVANSSQSNNMSTLDNSDSFASSDMFGSSSDCDSTNLNGEGGSSSDQSTKDLIENLDNLSREGHNIVSQGAGRGRVRGREDDDSQGDEQWNINEANRGHGGH